ncbi:MAG: hypothetical protein UZ19_OD1000822 [Parcubacteria bacterium OLB19]|nr:MAG: hypothetical protein UZ19_OD1000822 [Parcubacteria bacterium OLB19]
MLYEKIELEPNEEILKVVRKHWFIIVAELFGVVIMLLLPIFILFLLIAIPKDNLPLMIELDTHLPLIIYGLIVWTLFALMAGFMIWTHYFLDLWVITDRRIIVIDQVSFFNRKVSSFRLERLQDIKFSVIGLIATFLNFGTIRAQTAGMAENSFETHGLPDPQGLLSVIQKAMDIRLRYLGKLHNIVE